MIQLSVFYPSFSEQINSAITTISILWSNDETQVLRLNLCKSISNFREQNDYKRFKD